MTKINKCFIIFHVCRETTLTAHIQIEFVRHNCFFYLSTFRVKLLCASFTEFKKKITPTFAVSLVLKKPNEHLVALEQQHTFTIKKIGRS